MALVATAFEIEKCFLTQSSPSISNGMRIMRKSTDVCGGVNGRVRNLSACGGLSVVLDPRVRLAFETSSVWRHGSKYEVPKRMKTLCSKRLLKSDREAWYPRAYY